MQGKNKTNTQNKVAEAGEFSNIITKLETNSWWHLFLLIFLPFFIYIKSTGFELIDFDDTAIVTNNLSILSHFKNLGIAFHTDAFLNAHGDFYRPMQTISLMLDANIGGEKTWIYHLSNLLYHLFSVIALYYLLRLMGIKSMIAFFCTALFSIHPMLASAISWIPARGDLLMGLFGMLSFITFIKSLNKKFSIFFVLHALFFSIALFSKEVAILFPVLFVLYFIFFLRKEHSLKRLVPYIVFWLCIGILFVMLRSNIVINKVPDYIFGIQPFLSNISTFPIMLAKALFPLQLSTMPLFQDQYIFLGCFICIILVIYVVRQILQKNTSVLFGLIWFFLLTAPPMFFKIFYSKYLVEYYEHRSYVPMMGLIILLACVLNSISIQKHLKKILLIFLFTITTFSFLASAHSDDFKNSFAFFGKAASLQNPGAMNKRGELYFNERDFNNALSDFEETIAQSDQLYPPAFYNRGRLNALVNKNHIAAEEDFTQTIQLDSNFIDAYIDRAGERIFSQQFENAISDLQKAKRIDSNQPKIYFTLGNIYINSKNYPLAVNNYSKAIQIDSNYSEALNNRGMAYYQLKDYNSALLDYTKAITLFPEYLNARYNKGMIYFETNRPDAAIAEFDTTLSLANNFYLGYFYRGMAKKLKKDMKGACSDWNESVKLGFSAAADTLKKYCK